MKKVKIFCAVIFAVLLLTAVAMAAVNTTFSTGLLGAEHGTLGENEKLERQQAVDTEIRNRINGIATFVGYTSAQ